jgi:beta-lactam-binding protein with PASTA domain
LKLLNFFKSKIFWINTAIAAAVFFIAVTITMNWLDSYTQHGETITVPDLKGMNMEQVERQLKSKNLQYAVFDSLYEKDSKPNSVLDQNPKPDAKVKENRTIYITVNAFNPPQFKMPKLVDKSLRQAQIELESYGLVVGQLTYIPDMAQNAVLKQLVDGKEIKPGDLIAKGTTVDLVLGDGLGNSQVEVPFLLNLSLNEAKFVLTASSLNIGAVVFTGSISDTSKAVVVRQIPGAVGERMLNMGESIDLFLAAQFPDSLKYLLQENLEKFQSNLQDEED